MPRERPIRILYPPVVVAHISDNLGDLVTPYLNGKNEIEIYLSSQPNSRPHLGTLTTISSAFALAYHLRERFSLDAKVTFEVLDNAPALQREEEGVVYFKPMCFVEEEGEILSERNLLSFDHFMCSIGRRSGIAYSVKKYSDMQSSFLYRRKLREILNLEERLVGFLNPLGRVIKVRPLCPSCQYGEKSGVLTKRRLGEEELGLSSYCFLHGEYEEVIAFSGGTGFIDLNTPIRSLIRKTLLIEDSSSNDSLKIMVDGADWVGVSQQLLPCLGILGYSIDNLPVRFFAPLIEDKAGSKFSKSAYVKKGSYEGVHPAFCDYDEFKRLFGEEGIDLIWDETLEWILDSKKFFRNYTVDYFMQKWDLDLR